MVGGTEISVGSRLAAQLAHCAGAKSVAILSWYNAQAIFSTVMLGK